jgi:hypothetical protein
VAKKEFLSEFFKSDIPFGFQIQLVRREKLVDIGLSNQKVDFILIVRSYRFLLSLPFKGVVMGLAEAYLNEQIQIKGDLICALKIKNFVEFKKLTPLSLLKFFIYVLFFKKK